jgi:hypothetical protein
VKARQVNDSDESPEQSINSTDFIGNSADFIGYKHLSTDE